MFSQKTEYPATLTWNPKTGYSCTACNWKRLVHIGPQLPPDDEVLDIVRQEYAEHLREVHFREQGGKNVYLVL